MISCERVGAAEREGGQTGRTDGMFLVLASS